MRFISTVPLAALAAAFVVPDVNVFEQLTIQNDGPQDEVASFDNVLETSLEAFVSPEDIIWGKDAETGFFGPDANLDLALAEELEEASDHPGHHGDHDHHGHHGHHGHRHHGSNLTIYQLISESKYTTNFTKLVNEYDDLVDLLNSTKANFTLFVPTDSAFAGLPNHGDKKPSREFVEALLKYHIGLDTYTAHDILTTQTIPTALDEVLLGDEAQRLRVSLGFTGIKVNFYSRVIAANLEAKNGIIHAVNHIIVPPPFVGRGLSLFPNVFSTLLLAYEKTDFVKFIHNVPTNGTTVFAPSNFAWTRLGARANAFLFNSPKGLHYLKALLKYQIVANTTLYSDAIYTNDGKTGEEDVRAKVQFDLPTLLDELPVRVTIKKWAGFVKFVVNDYVHVVVRDGVARNGVIQVVDKVPIPPCKRGEGSWWSRWWRGEGGEIEVEDLMERLAPYVELDGVGEQGVEEASDL